MTGHESGYTSLYEVLEQRGELPPQDCMTDDILPYPTIKELATDGDETG